MQKAGKFRRNRATIARILKTVDGGKREIAEQLRHQMNDPEVKIEVYTTDREVVGIMVPADKQAKYGIGTKAINTVKEG
jgi:hypothetical protein